MSLTDPSSTPSLPVAPRPAPADLIIDGRRIWFVWNPPRITPIRVEGGLVTAHIATPSLPKGIIIAHPGRRPEDVREDGTVAECVAWLSWARAVGDDGPVWDLLSIAPLSVREGFVCGRCGDVGGIREGRWWLGRTDQ